MFNSDVIYKHINNTDVGISVNGISHQTDKGVTLNVNWLRLPLTANGDTLYLGNDYIFIKYVDIDNWVEYK
jgi:hypothetical protein